MNEAERQSRIYARQHKIYERRIYPIFLNALKKQIQPVVDWITETQNIHPPLDKLVDPKIFRLPIVRAYELVAQLAAKREYFYIREQEKGIIDFLIDKWRQIFYEYASNYAEIIKFELSDVTKEEISKALLYSYENQFNADQTAAYIRKEVQNRISRARAVTISRTEATTASNLGKNVGARSWLAEVGQRGYKQYLGREDKRERGYGTDHGHWALNNTFLPIDDKFTFVDAKGVTSQGDIPGDVNLPANQRICCRCTVMYLSERRYLRLTSGQ